MFFEETFGGNGRTCGTCHPASTLTLSPEDIAALPADDPLFAGALDINPEFLARGLFQYPLGGTLLEPEINVLRAIPSVANVRGTSPFTADGRAPRLQDQALEAVLLHALDGAVDQPGERVPTADELDAIAAFQNSLQPSTARGRRGDRRADSRLVRAGRRLFNGKARCSTCHTGELFTDNDFHDIGVTRASEFFDPLPFDPGRCRIEPTANDCAVSGESFNTMPLRGVSVTAPFFHNNRAATLENVLGFYNSSTFASSPAAIRLGIGALNLTDEEIAAVVAFLESL